MYCRVWRCWLKWIRIICCIWIGYWDVIVVRWRNKKKEWNIWFFWKIWVYSWKIWRIEINRIYLRIWDIRKNNFVFCFRNGKFSS